jgi:hypothetical protein
MSKELAPNSGTYLCSMQGSSCGAWTLWGNVSSYGTGCEATKDINKALLG